MLVYMPQNQVQLYTVIHKKRGSTFVMIIVEKLV